VAGGDEGGEVGGQPEFGGVQGGVGEPVHPGLVDLPAEARRPGRGRGQVVDDGGAAGFEQLFRIGGDTAAVQHQQVERARR